MKFRFVLENGKRRTLANALGEAMNAEVRYLGAPTFCFEVGGGLLDMVTSPTPTVLASSLRVSKVSGTDFDTSVEICSLVLLGLN